MIPTRTQIQEKIDEILSLDGSLQQDLINWLNSIECPSQAIEKIIADINSYHVTKSS